GGRGGGARDGEGREKRPGRGRGRPMNKGGKARITQAPRPAAGKQRAGTCHPSLQGAKPVKRRFFLFWRHGCSAARNSPACKGKSLRCLRKSRFAYIDTSQALSARRHLTAALRPSRLHLGCQTHQTWCAPGHLGAVA